MNVVSWNEMVRREGLRMSYIFFTPAMYCVWNGLFVVLPTTSLVPSGDAIHRRCKEDAKNTTCIF